MGAFETRSAEELRPPYFYFNAWRTFREKFAADGMPDSVSDILADYGATTKHHLRSGLRSLKLIDEQNRATERLRRLAQATGEEYQELLGNLLKETYPYMLGPEAGDFDALNADRGELIARFKQVLGTTGNTTATRCTDFFRQAVREAGLVQESIESNGQTNKPAQETRTSISQYRSAAHEGSLPPLPPYEQGWPDEIKKLWFEMRHLEVMRQKS